MCIYVYLLILAFIDNDIWHRIITVAFSAKIVNECY